MLTIEEQKVDAILGVLYKNSDASDEPDQTWLDGDKFHSTAQQILSALQAMEAPQPHLDKANVMRGEAEPFYCANEEAGMCCAAQCELCRMDGGF